MYICIYKPWLEIRVGVKHLDTPLGLCKLTPRPYNVVTVTHDLAFVINPTVVKASVLLLVSTNKEPGFYPGFIELKLHM